MTYKEVNFHVCVPTHFQWKMSENHFEPITFFTDLHISTYQRCYSLNEAIITEVLKQYEMLMQKYFTSYFCSKQRWNKRFKEISQNRLIKETRMFKNLEFHYKIHVSEMPSALEGWRHGPGKPCDLTSKHNVNNISAIQYRRLNK